MVEVELRNSNFFTCENWLNFTISNISNMIEIVWNKSLSSFSLFHCSMHLPNGIGDYALQFLSSSASTVHFRCFEHRRSDLVKDVSSWVRSFGFFMGGLRSIMLVPWLIDWFAVRMYRTFPVIRDWRGYREIFLDTYPNNLMPRQIFLNYLDFIQVKPL